MAQGVPTTAIVPAASRAPVPRGGPGRAVLSPGAIARRPQVRHGLAVDAGTLHAGTASVRLADVIRYDASGLSEKDYPTAFATMGIFSAVAGAIVFAVVETGWRVKFLLEGVLFGAIALCALVELFSAKRHTLYTFKIVSASGDELVYVTANAGEARKVKRALDKALGGL